MFCVEEVQGGFEMDQVKTLVPAVNPVICDVGEVGVVIAPLPETKTQRPVPLTGALAVMVAVPGVAQTV